MADSKRAIREKDYVHDASYICSSPWQRMVISWEGKVVQCCEDYMEGNVLGNVNVETLKEIWHGEPFKELRKLMKSGRRLRTKPCRICSDGGITVGGEIAFGKREIKFIRHMQHGIDVKDIVSASEKTDEKS